MPETETRPDRIGQYVRFCYQPLMVARIMAWDAARMVWVAQMTTPKASTRFEWGEDLMKIFEQQGSVSHDNFK